MLRFLTALGTASLGGALAILLLLALTPSLARRFAPDVRYRLWRRLVALLIIVPALMALLPAVTLPHIIQVETPQVLEESRYRGMENLQEDRENARRRGYTDGTEFRGPGGYRLEMRGEDGRSLVIEENPAGRTVTENGVSVHTIHWATLLFLVWLAGALVHTALIWGSYLRFRKEVRRWARPADGADMAALAAAQTAARCPVAPALLRCPSVPVPLVTGLIHPVVLLPDTMPEHVREPALAHELTHLREGHLRDRALFVLARSVHWFNPLVWKMVRQAGEDQELCCDWSLIHDRDASARRAYGRAILDQMTWDPVRLSPLTTGFSGDRKEIFRRFRAIMDRAPRKRGRAVALFLTLMILLSQTLVSCGSGGAPGSAGAGSSSGGASEPAGQGSSSGGSSGGADSSASAQAAVSAGAWDVEPLLVRGALTDDGTAITGRKGPWDQKAVNEWQVDWEETEIVWPLAEDLESFYRLGDDTYFLNPTVLRQTLTPSRYGGDRIMELIVDDAGEVTRLVLRGGVEMDLSGEDLDFTGYTGLVCARGISLRHEADGSLRLDPCKGPDLTFDEDDTWTDHDVDTVYYLPPAPGADLSLPERLPDLCAIQVVNGLAVGVGEYLPFMEYLDYWNNTQYEYDRGIQVAPAFRDGETWFRFYGSGINLYIDRFTHDPGDEDWGQKAVLEYGGRAMDLDLPMHPLQVNLGHYAGECNMWLRDLTADGVPEVIFTSGYHNSGFGEDEALVFDAANMESLPVKLDFSILSDSLSVTWLEERMEGDDRVAAFRVETADGQTATGTVPMAETDTLENMGGIVTDSWYTIGPNDAGDGLVLEYAAAAEDREFYWLGWGEVPLVLDPATKTFTMSRTFTLKPAQ